MIKTEDQTDTKPATPVKAVAKASARRRTKAKAKAPSKGTKPKGKASFDYADLGDAALETAKQVVARINKSQKDSITAIVEIGKGLDKVKEAAEEGSYLRWIAMECRFTRRTASNYVSVAKAFPERAQWETVSHLQQGVLYKLATAPEEVRAEVTGSAKPLSGPDVLKLIGSARRQSEKPEAGGGLPELPQNRWTPADVSRFLARCLKPADLDRLRKMAAQLEPDELLAAFGASEPAGGQNGADPSEDIRKAA